MLDLAGDFYKNLFGFEKKLEVNHDDSFWNDNEKITRIENEMVEALFSESEIKEVVFDSYVDGAPCPDEFSFLFYQHFWDLIKQDLMSLFKLFEMGELNLYRLNYTIITLITKQNEAKHLKKFRPISLINCSFKFFAKAMNNRLIKIVDRLISSNQPAFIKGRYILESVVCTRNCS